MIIALVVSVAVSLIGLLVIKLHELRLEIENLKQSNRILGDTIVNLMEDMDEESEKWWEGKRLMEGVDNGYMS